MSFRSRRQQGMLMALIGQAGDNVRDCGLLLADLLRDYPEHAALAGEIERCEQEGDRLTREIKRRLSVAGRLRAPFTVAEGFALASALDDIVDHAEQASAQLTLYGVEAPMEQAVELAVVLVGACEQVAQALKLSPGGAKLAPLLGEIHQLESEGDRVQRDGLASLFAGGIDPMVVIRWKDIFESLESALDACERVAQVLEGVAARGPGKPR